MEVARLTGCKNFSRARPTAYGLIEALDWGCTLRVTQQFAKLPEHVAIRAHHIRVRAPEAVPEGHNNLFHCWLAAMTETPFRVTLDLRIGSPPAGAKAEASAPASPADFHVQAEVFKQEWEAFRNLPQPWQVELAPDRLFLLPD